MFLSALKNYEEYLDSIHVEEESTYEVLTKAKEMMKCIEKRIEVLNEDISLLTKKIDYMNQRSLSLIVAYKAETMFLNLRISNMKNYIEQYKLFNKNLKFYITKHEYQVKMLDIELSNKDEILHDLDINILSLQDYIQTLKWCLYPVKEIDA